MIGGDVELIQTPGATAVLWDDDTHRFLFTADTLWIEHGRWSVVVLGDSDHTA